MDHTHPVAVIGDVVSGTAAWLLYSGFIHDEMKVGILSELAAGVSILWFTARFIAWVWDRLDARRRRHHKCRCGKRDFDE